MLHAKLVRLGGWAGWAAGLSGVTAVWLSGVTAVSLSGVTAVCPLCLVVPQRNLSCAGRRFRFAVFRNTI